MNIAVIEFCKDFEHLKEREEFWVGQHIGKPGCMNFNSQPIGFDVGDRNPNKSPKNRLMAAERMTGDKNPTKRPEVRKKMSESLKPLTKGIKIDADKVKNQCSVCGGFFTRPNIARWHNDKCKPRTYYTKIEN